MSQKPLPDPATRLDLAKKLIASAKIPKAPPAGFIPSKATDDELKLHGLPPKPDAKTDPKRYAKWSKHLSNPVTFVAPTFKIVEKDRNPLAKNPGTIPKGATSGNWSGYVITDPSPNKYSIVEGEWIVPDPYPNCTNADGTYWAALWVGIDGWSNGEVFQSGVDVNVTVSGGNITGRSTLPWYEWYPAYPAVISNFPVSPGDTIWGYVDATSTTLGYAYLYNVNARAYTSVSFSPPSGTALQGTSAEWILEDPGMPEVMFPNFGSTAFFDCYAYCGVWQTLSNGGIPINLVENGATLAEPIDECTTSFIDIYTGC